MYYFWPEKDLRFIHDTLVDGRVLTLARSWSQSIVLFLISKSVIESPKISDEKRFKNSRSGVLDRFINSIYVHVDETRGLRAMVWTSTAGGRHPRPTGSFRWIARKRRLKGSFGNQWMELRIWTFYSGIPPLDWGTKPKRSRSGSGVSDGFLQSARKSLLRI